VRGHSGDPDNDRCDAIAVAFSRGGSPDLAHEDDQREMSRRPTPKPSAAAATEAKDTAAKDAEVAPQALVQLLSRLELADRLAAGGYGLTAVELARLLEVPLASLEGKQDPWPWRDWLVVPLPGGRWRLERGAGGLSRPE